MIAPEEGRSGNGETSRPMLLRNNLLVSALIFAPVALILVGLRGRHVGLIGVNHMALSINGSVDLLSLQSCRRAGQQEQREQESTAPGAVRRRP